MIIVLKRGVSDQDIQFIADSMSAKGLSVSKTVGASHTILALVGDTSRISQTDIEKYSGVEKVLAISRPYQKVERISNREKKSVDVAGISFGLQQLPIIAGPCSVESEEQIIQAARSVQKSGASMLRGGAYKPRTSPYSFQGLGSEGIKLLVKARQETGLPIVSELMSVFELDEFVEHVDLIQIGARNMQNFDLLKRLGKTRKPILLKRGMSATIEEWLLSAEYILAEGNENVILCERGIRTYETLTRNTLDLQAIPVVQRLSHLPIIVDPSHAAGYTYLVAPMAKAAVMAGAHGLMVEVHPDPQHALTDGQQSLDLNEFAELMPILKELSRCEGKTIPSTGARYAG